MLRKKNFLISMLIALILAVLANYSVFASSTADIYFDLADGIEAAPAPMPDENNSDSERGVDSPYEESTTQTPKELQVGIIEAIELEDDKLQKIADDIGIEKGELHLLTNEDFTTTTPPEPTQSMRDEVAGDGYEFAAKLNTVNVKEDGYYVFKLTIPDDLVGTKVSDLKLYYAEDSDFHTSSQEVRTAFFNGALAAYEINAAGVRLNNLTSQIIAAVLLQSGKSLTVYILKILLMLLGGCNVGIGIAGALVVGVVAVKFFRKRK